MVLFRRCYDIPFEHRHKRQFCFHVAIVPAGQDGKDQGLWKLCAHALYEDAKKAAGLPHHCGQHGHDLTDYCDVLVRACACFAGIA